MKLRPSFGKQEKSSRLASALLLAAWAACGGCDDKSPAPPPAAPSEAEHQTATNRIDIPAAVRQNLGITFAKVERRPVRATIRVPGRFELLPSARREFRAVLPGRVELAVKQYDAVSPGQVVARLDSPDWRRLQHEAVEAEGEIKVAQAAIDVACAAVAENQTNVDLLRERVNSLTSANAPSAALAAELALAESRAARLQAEVRSAEVKLDEANEHYLSRLRTLSAVVGVPTQRLLEPAPATSDQAATQAATRAVEPAEHADMPLWRTIELIELRATQAGVVESLAVTSGGWAEANALVLTTVDPKQLRFRGSALQSDLQRFDPNAPATILPPAGNASAEPARATAAIGLNSNPDTRTVELLLTPRQTPPWAMPGVTTVAEVTTDPSAEAELAIPRSAVIQDDLTRVYFRRDPKNPDQVIRTEADLGDSDGRWVVVRSGVKAGDEVVLDGVYELKLTGGGQGPGGAGHFHADGTWHAAGTPEK